MRTLILLIIAIVYTGVNKSFAQKSKGEVEGTPYYLPCTGLRFAMLVEKTVYTPGEFAVYAEKYLKKKDVSTEPSVEYRIADVKITSIAERDTSKSYLAPTDAKHNIRSLKCDERGLLLAVNADPKTIAKVENFIPEKKKQPLNPRDYMNEDILSAGSYAKMAELCASEIYDIRESKSLLNKGQAEFMPKDGEQLRIMLDNLSTQEAALNQLFCGTTETDTTQVVVEFMPKNAITKQLLFRFSKWMGMTDVDDLGGEPYYISVEDLHILPAVQENIISQKPPKDNVGLYFNVPGKIKVTLFKGNEQWTECELYAGQFGRVEQIDDNLFGRKFTTSIVLSPITGNLDDLQSEPVKK